jgi:hypothetical protein
LNKQKLLEWIQDNKGKTIAIIIACFYLIAGLVIGERLRVALFLILPLACIFFSDAMGGYTGMSRLGAGPWITKTTPGCFVAFVGWLLLLFPLGFAIFKAFFK